jgi:hypothetical protein
MDRVGRDALPRVGTQCCASTAHPCATSIRTAQPGSRIRMNSVPRPIRWEWDSNPRGLPATCFPGRHNRPLCHPTTPGRHQGPTHKEALLISHGSRENLTGSLDIWALFHGVPSWVFLYGLESVSVCPSPPAPQPPSSTTSKSLRQFPSASASGSASRSCRKSDSGTTVRTRSITTRA